MIMMMMMITCTGVVFCNKDKIQKIINDDGHLHRGGDIAVAELPSGVPVLHLDVLAQAAADSFCQHY